jgi:ABC-2 type transport system ATP-binding protein
MLEARGLTKFYAAIPAIRDITFTLAPGCVLGLLGPNGSGKSTTVSILAGLVEPSGGHILVDGVEMSDRRIEYKARLGYVPEEAHLYAYLTGPEYLTLIGRLRSLPEASLQAKISGFLELFGLTDDWHAPMAAYSKGMRQKVLLAAALLHNPEFVILDEPDSGLDVTTSLVLRSLVHALAEEGRMVLYSSHVLEIVEQIATDVLILHDGRVAAHGSVSELRRLLASTSLQQVFRRLVVADDIDGMARTMVEVMKG